MNQKGILASNTLGVIIAVIALALLSVGVYGAVKSYIYQDRESAKNVLDSVESKINALDNVGKTSFPIHGPKDWYLTAWGLEEKESNKPEKCYFKSCICICKASLNIGDSKDKLISLCQSTGICRFPEFSKIEVRGVNFEKYARAEQAGLGAGDIYSGTPSEKGKAEYIKFKGTLIEVQVEMKDKKTLVISDISSLDEQN